jgi:hypothetical protein
MPDAKSGVTVPLAEGVDTRGVEPPQVHLAMNELDGAIELGLHHSGEVVDSAVIAPPDGPKPLSVHLGPLSVEVALGADNERGEAVIAEGRVRVRDDGEEWRTIADLEGVFRYAPAHGSVGGSTKPDPPAVADERFGRSRMSSRNVTRFFVEDRKRHLADVGRVVKGTLWDDYPDWVFNTVACVGEFDEQGRGSYGDPTSGWFNVFLGYYQIDAPKPDWDRPFAYEAARGAASRVRFDEIIRLGKSDWNYFSNWMYGVPAPATERHNDFDVQKVNARQAEAGVIGRSSWHRVRIEGVDFVSAYEADHPDAERLVHNSVLGRLWRKAFGQPKPHPDYRESFIGTTLDADMYIAHWEDDEAFHTTIFGGTAPTGGDPDFLARQLDAARAVIERSYGEIGFAAE